MARDVTVEICGISIDATPHPEDVYIQLLRKGSTALVKARGSDYAKITNPRKYDEPGYVFTGRILVWTDINAKGKWLDLSREDEVDPKILAQINIPPDAKPNYRSFTYLFDSRRHRFWFESKNDLGDTIGPTTVLRVMQTITSPDIQGEKSPDVEVSIVPEEGALGRILSLPRLKAIVIRVARPNADYSSPEAKRRVRKRLNDLNAQTLEVKMTKASEAGRLTLTPEYQELAEVASDTGYVKGTGSDSEGNLTVVSTKDIPKRLYVDPEMRGGLISRMLRTIGLL